MERTLRGTTALVVGAGHPLADAVARRLAAEGARLALVHLPQDAGGAARTAASIDAAFLAPCDIASPDAVRGIVRQVVTVLGTLDVLANLAVCRADGAAHHLDDDAWQRVVDVELSGVLYFCRDVIRPMMRQRGGRIINLTDVAGMRGEAAAANHSSARAGVAAMTRALASELAPHRIFVNALSVSYLDHEVEALGEGRRGRLLRNTPLGRAGAADEVADAALFLALSSTSFTTGHLLQVNGGLYL